MRFIKKKKIIDENVKIDPITDITSSFFYTGYFPAASGTVASLAALAVFLLKIFQDPLILSLLVIVSFVSGIITSKTMMKRYGNDPSVVVIDEAAGMWITVLIVLILSPGRTDLLSLAICFLAFRFFDITKIQPAKYFDKLHTGFGVMMDDVVAGVYAGVVSYFIILIVKS